MDWGLTGDCARQALGRGYGLWSVSDVSFLPVRIAPGESAGVGPDRSDGAVESVSRYTCLTLPWPLPFPAIGY
jgi:hypothetical protein